tara:strand:- start:32933 stop:33247 length:315 start_codon:yes stop_codon:yes gene_type:complete
MTKLEELTALLVNELNDFNKGIERLEKINEQLKDTKIKMDVAEYKAIIEEHQKEIASQLNSIASFEKRFNDKIEQAKIYPNWAVIVFMICIIVTIVLISYMILK